MKYLPLLSLFFSLSAFACLPQNENLIVPEHAGEENLMIASIDTATSTIERHRDGFRIKEVALNGAEICGATSQACADRIRVQNGPLASSDRLRIVIGDVYDGGADLVFNRVSAARDLGSLCRPIFPN